MRLKIETGENIENIIFDLGGVLLDIDVRKTLDAFEKLHIKGLKAEDIYPNLKSCFLELEIGALSPDEFIEAIRKEYPDARNVDEMQFWKAWNALLLDFVPACFDLLEKVRRDYRIYLLSNTNLPHRKRYLQRFEEQMHRPFESYFEKCYYSDALHMRKPDKAIYEYVVRDAGIDPCKTLFIDDNTCNFSGAEEAGLHCYHLKKGHNIAELFERI